MSELEAVIEKAAGGKMRPLPVRFLEGPTVDPRPGESPRASPQTKRGLGVLHCRSRRAGQQEPPYTRIRYSGTLSYHSGSQI